MWTIGIGLHEKFDKYAFFYNKELDMVIVAMKIGFIFVYIQKEKDGEWILHKSLTQECGKVSRL